MTKNVNSSPEPGLNHVPRFPYTMNIVLISETHRQLSHKQHCSPKQHNKASKTSQTCIYRYHSCFYMQRTSSHCRPSTRGSGMAQELTVLYRCACRCATSHTLPLSTLLLPSSPRTAVAASHTLPLSTLLLPSSPRTVQVLWQGLDRPQR